MRKAKFCDRNQGRLPCTCKPQASAAQSAPDEREALQRLLDDVRDVRNADDVAFGWHEAAELFGAAWQRAQSAPDEREAFEAAVVKVALANGYSFMGELLKRDAEGSYRQSWVDSSWLVHQAWQRAQSAPAVPDGPNYKFKFETLVEHCKRQDQVISELRYDQNIRRFYDDGAVWFWCGDETDNLQTLACPVVINAGDLRAMLAAAPQPAARQEQGDEVPMQPIVWGKDGCIRFKENRIVRYLLDFATPRGCGLNELAHIEFTAEERMQLAQLIGYSVSGYGDLSYASPESVERADEIAAALSASAEGK